MNTGVLSIYYVYYVIYSKLLEPWGDSRAKLHCVHAMSGFKKLISALIRIYRKVYIQINPADYEE